MEIKEEYILTAKNFINKNYQVLMLENTDIKELLKNSEESTDDTIELISNIIIAYKNIKKISNKTNCKDIINYVDNSNLNHEIRLYVGYILVSEYGVNPFKLFNNIDSKDLFWRIHSYFEETFTICSETSFDVVLECIYKVYQFTKRDIAQVWIFGKINKYFERFFDTNELLISAFFQQPEDSLQICVMMAIDNIIKIDENKTKYILELLLRSEIPLNRSIACAYYSNIAETHWHMVCEKVDEIFSLCDKCSEDLFLGNSMRLFITILATQQNQDIQQRLKLEKVIRDYSEGSNYIKLSILQELNSKFKVINEFSYEIYKRLFSTRISDNLGLIQELDNTAYQLLRTGKMNEVYSFLKLFYTINCDNFQSKTFRECFNSTFFEITSKFINQIIPELYKDIISRNKILVNFSMKFFQQIAFSSNFKRINLTQKVTESNILTIIKVITSRCFKAEFVCYFGLKLLDIKLSKQVFINYKKFYIDKISGNYPNTSKEIVEGFDKANEQQKLLINAVSTYVQEREENYKRVKAIKDFQPSAKRVLQYSIANDKRNKKAMKLAQEKSVLMKLVTKQHIKYGKRYSTNIQLENSEFRLSENEFSCFEYSQEMPIKYISDPLCHLYDRLEIISQGGDEDETDY